MIKFESDGFGGIKRKEPKLAKYYPYWVNKDPVIILKSDSSTCAAFKRCIKEEHPEFTQEEIDLMIKEAIEYWEE